MTPLSVVEGGRTWHKFSCEYDTADGKFGFYIYAISFEHAVAMLEELKQTARVDGQVLRQIKADR